MKNKNTTEKPIKRVRRARKKVLRFFLFGVASSIFIVYFFYLVVNMSIEIANKYEEKDTLTAELNELKEKEAELSLDVLKLQDPEYVARYLREKYYYSKEDEYIIKLPNEK